MKAAAVDIGTNTVLLLVAECTSSGDVRAVAEHAEITRLGQGVDRTRELAPEAVSRTVDAIVTMGRIIREHGVCRVDVVGTSAMRDARGGDSLCERIERELGVRPRVISGDDEARLTFIGATSGISTIHPGTPIRVFDIGGGSTEVVHGVAASVDVMFAKSFDVGSVRLTERCVRHDPPTMTEQVQIAREASAAFTCVPEFDSPLPPIGIAGTMTTLAAVSLRLETYDPCKVHGTILRLDELERVLAELSRLPLSARCKVAGLEPKRADVIVAGGLIALSYLRRAHADAVMISDRGVRWGLVAQMLA